MIKKTIIIFTSFILCNAICVAQDIDKATYYKWVDYVNCKYAEAYFDKKIKYTANKRVITDGFRKDYREKFKPKLKETTKDNVKAREGILKDLKKAYKNGGVLINFIDSKKNAFDPDWDREQIIENLIALPKKPNFDEYLQEAKKTLKKDLEKKLPKQEKKTANSAESRQETTLQESDNILKITSSKTTGDIAAVQTASVQTETKKSSNNLLRHVFFWIILAGLTFLAYHERQRLKKNLLPFIKGMIARYNKNSQKKNSGDSAELSRPKPGKQQNSLSVNHPEESKFKKLEEENRFLKITNRQLEQENQALREEIEESEGEKQALQDEIDVLERENQALREEIEKKEQPSSGYLYADAIIDGYFNKVKETPNEDTIFELHLRSESSSTFTVYRESYRRVISCPDFLEGCEKQALLNGQNVKIESQGAAQKQSDGRWKISKKAAVIMS
jgi:hypothetical protein